jgi:Bacteriocin-protection, YdeI or OmpD-Associated
VVADQPREGPAPDRGGQDAPIRARRSRAGEGRRPLGRGLRRPEEHHRARRLQRELDARPQARAFFAGLNSQNRYAILYRLQDAKKPETRARRLAQFVAMLEAGETIYA